MSSGKLPTLVNTTLLPGKKGVMAVASLPTSPSRDVTANIPIQITSGVSIVAESIAETQPISINRIEI